MRYNIFVTLGKGAAGWGRGEGAQWEVDGRGAAGGAQSITSAPRAPKPLVTPLQASLICPWVQVFLDTTVNVGYVGGPCEKMDRY